MRTCDLGGAGGVRRAGLVHRPAGRHRPPPRGSALALGIPVAPVPTLDAMAAPLPFADAPVCPLLDARRARSTARSTAGPGRRDGAAVGLPGAAARRRVAARLDGAGDRARRRGRGVPALPGAAARARAARGRSQPCRAVGGRGGRARPAAILAGGRGHPDRAADPALPAAVRGRAEGRAMREARSRPDARADDARGPGRRAGDRARVVPDPVVARRLPLRADPEPRRPLLGRPR